MDNLKESFDDVADWCETHLEDRRGREIGMTFGAMLRVYGRLAKLPARPDAESLGEKEQELNAKAEHLLWQLSTRFLVAYGRVRSKINPVDPISMRTNMTYDSRPRPQE